MPLHPLGDPAAHRAVLGEAGLEDRPGSPACCFARRYILGSPHIFRADMWL